MHKCKKHPCPKPATCKCRVVRDARVPIIWIIGGTGSGKNTLSNALADKYGFNIYNPAAMLRAEMATGSAKGAEYNECMLNGTLVPDEDIVSMLEKDMTKQRKSSKGYVISSFPKTASQGEFFETYVAPVDAILYLKCADETMIARTAKRSDEAGMESHRDDNETTAKIRLEMFNRYINELLEKYADQVKEINAEASVEMVLAEVLPIVDETIAKKLENTPEPTCN